MSDVNISKYRAQVIRQGSTPASPGFAVAEGQNPVDPSGSGQNHLPVTIATATTGLSITESQILSGAGLVSQYIRGDGSLADFPASTGGGSSVSYYLNGSVSQGTIGGVAYKQLNRTPVFGAGTDFTINADGYIASFITDASDPNKLLIPAGNWNFETYFSASSNGGSPSFYVELYKYDGTTFTLIATSSSAPELIAFGTSLNPYYSTLAVPQTTLALTDRLAIRYYVTHSGRTITLHTEDNHLCQIITTFTTGLTALNGLTAQVQNFAVGTSGTDFAIASATATHTFNLPTASATNRGALSSADWSTFNGKTSNLGTVTSVGLSSATSGVTIGSTPVTTSGTITLAIATASGSQNGLLSSTDWTTFNNKQNLLTNPVTGTGTTNYLPKFTGSTTIGNSQVFDNGTNVGIGTASPLLPLDVVINNSTAYLTTSRANTLRAYNISSSANIFAGIELAADGPANAGVVGINGVVTGSGSGAMTFYTRDSSTFGEKMRLVSNGNLLVGTTTDAGYKLDVNGTGRFGGTSTYNGFLIASHSNNVGAAIYNKALANATLYADSASTVLNAETNLYLRTGNTDRLTIASTGAATFSSSVTALSLVGSESFDGLINALSTRNASSGTSARNRFRFGNDTSVNAFTIDVFGSNHTGQSNNVNLSIQTSTGSLIFGTNGTDRMRLTSGGNVLIGTTTDSGYKLRVNGSVLAGNHVVTSGSTAPALNATETLASGVSYAIIAIYETTNTGKGCILLMAAGVLTLVSNPSGDYTITVNTANKWNVTVSSGVISIQNNRANGDAFNATINRLD